MLIPKESQDYGMMEVGRASSGACPVQSVYKGPSRDNCPGSCPGILEIPQPLRSTAPLLGHPHGKKVFHDPQRETSCLNMCSLPLILSLSTTEKSLAPIFFASSLQAFLYIHR